MGTALACRIDTPREEGRGVSRRTRQEKTARIRRGETANPGAKRGREETSRNGVARYSALQ